VLRQVKPASRASSKRDAGAFLVINRFKPVADKKSVDI